MKKTFNLKYSLLLFFGYVAYLLMQGPINLLLENFPLPILYKSSLASIILLLPLLVLTTFLLIRLDLKKSLTSKSNKIFLLPAAYLLFNVAMSFSAYKDAISLDFLLFLFGLCLVGFSEEFLFRGILFQKFCSFFPSIYLAAIASSSLFGVAHFVNLVKHPESINEITYQVIYAFCFGILMCGIFYKTKNLIIPALLHTFINLEAQIRTYNAIRGEQIPLPQSSDIFHPSVWELLNQELMFNLFCLLTGFSLIFYQKRKESGNLNRPMSLI